MNKPFIVHYKNKYPGGMVQAGDSHLDVYDSSGEHVVALRKNGAGQWVCQSEELGCRDRHDLAPIPKNSRCHKLFPEGHIAPAEEFDERKPVSQALADLQIGGPGKVPSIDELVKAGQSASLIGESDKPWNWSYKGGTTQKSAPKA